MKKIAAILLLAFFPTHSAFAECLVDVDISCPAKSTTIDWSGKDLSARLKLFQSSSVQSSARSCLAFAEIIKMECEIPYPVTSVMMLAWNRKVVSVAVGGDPKLYSKRDTLPQAFIDYLESKPDLEVNQKALGVVAKIGSQNFQRITDFLAATNFSTEMIFNMSCPVGFKKNVCGFDFHCKSSKNTQLGDVLTITKVGSLDKTQSWCNQSQIMSAVVEQFEAIYLGLIDENLKLVIADQPASNNFSAFGAMPLISQLSGFLQGLSIQKYGVDMTEPGLCVPTSNTMMAMALKSESPYSHLDNIFDKSSPTQISMVRKDNNPDQPVNLKYGEHASFVDEISRHAGLLERYPHVYDYYRNFFYNPLIKDAGSQGFMGVGGLSIFDFESSYGDALVGQTFVENNYKSWVSEKKGLTLALLSTASQPSNMEDTYVVGHSVTLNGFSGDNMIVYDPMGVVSHVKFSDYRYPDAGALISRIPNPDLNNCMSQAPTRCASVATRCMDQFSMVQSAGSVLISGCGEYSSNPTYDQVYNRCLSSTRCPIYFDLTRPSGTYRMLHHTGLGQAYIGGPSLEGHKTASYVVGYLLAEPWPYVATLEEARKVNQGQAPVTVETKNSNPLGQTCTALNRGQIVVSGQTYEFENPIPKLNNSLLITSSATPVEAPCTGLRRVLADGAVDKVGVDLFGTFSVTCGNGILRVTSNKCGNRVGPRSCQLANGTGNQYPIVKEIGTARLESFEGLSPCRATQCNPGFSGSDCSCRFYESVSGSFIPGIVTSAGECIASGCPVGSVRSPFSTDNVCVPVGGSCNEARADINRDTHGRLFSEYAQKNANYVFNQEGKCIWNDCKDGYVKNLTSASPICLASPDKLEFIKASSGSTNGIDCNQGFVRDRSGNFCVSRFSSCHVWNGIGNLTPDTRPINQCLLTHCNEGYREVAWSAPKYTIKDIEDMIHPNLAQGRICTKDAGITAVENLGLVKTVNGTSYLIEDIDSLVRNSLEDLSSFEHDQNLSLFPKVGGTCTDENGTAGRSIDGTCVPLSGEIEHYWGHYDQFLGPFFAPKFSCTNLPLYSDDHSHCLDFQALGQDCNLLEDQTLKTKCVQWRVSEKMPLSLLNCTNTPGSIMLESGCLYDYEQKIPILGDCFVEHGKGKWNAQRGCLVENCFSGFVKSADGRMCLNDKANCRFSDVIDSGAGAIRFLGTGIVGENGFPTNLCRIQSCKAGYTYVGIDKKGGFEDCKPNGEEIVFQAAKAVGFPLGTPGTRCSVLNGEGLRWDDGSCRPQRCNRGYTLSIQGCLRTDDRYYGYSYNPTTVNPVISSQFIAKQSIGGFIQPYLFIDQRSSRMRSLCTDSFGNPGFLRPTSYPTTMPNCILIGCKSHSETLFNGTCSRSAGEEITHYCQLLDIKNRIIGRGVMQVLKTNDWDKSAKLSCKITECASGLWPSVDQSTCNVPPHTDYGHLNSLFYEYLGPVNANINRFRVNIVDQSKTVVPNSGYMFNWFHIY